MAYRAAGIAIPRTSREQYRLLPKVPRGQARPGDLAFWASNPADPSTVHHVAIFIGAGMMIDAPRPGTVVSVRRVYTSGLMPYVARPGGVNAPAYLPIKRGDRGDDVRALQRRLRAQGHDVPVTGYYGPMTYAAVRQVQVRMGYSGSGYVGGATWGYLVTHGARLWVS
jgi:cell wall-associated NlpC family hydrolase